MRALRRAVAAELVKLCGLPSVAATVAGTVATGAGLGAAVAASDVAMSGDGDPGAVVLAIVPFLQVGAVLLGVLAVATEYAGTQIRTSAVAVPRRALLLAAKALAFLTCGIVLSSATVLGGLAGAATAGGGEGAAPIDWPPLAGAATYLVLIGLLAFALTALLRSLVAPLAGMLCALLVVSPLLASTTDHARWLPDRAGRLLYQPGADTILTTSTGAVVLLAWIALTATTATLTFTTRDT